MRIETIKREVRGIVLALLLVAVTTVIVDSLVTYLGIRRGSVIYLLAVLVSGAEGQTRVGSPLLDGAKVTATVIDHGRESKVIVFKKKRRKHYKRTKGHRQGYTTLKIESIG